MFLKPALAWGPVPALIAFLVWLFLRHRNRYREWRTPLALLRALCFAIQLVPVAPPRMHPDLGSTDTGVVFGHFGLRPAGRPGADAARRDALGPRRRGGPDRLVGHRPRQQQMAVTGLSHSALTCLVVVTTAKHWWLDGIVAAGLFIAVQVVVPRASAPGRAAWPVAASPQPPPLVAEVAAGAVPPPPG